jgi:hypothetical protein
MANEAVYKVAYDEAVRALSEQQLVIDSFRSRAGLLLSAGAVTTSFFGAPALDGGLGLLSWFALSAFVAMAAALLAVLWPRKWEIASSSHDVIATYIEAAEPAPLEELHEELSLHMHASYLANQRSLEKLVVLFQVATLLMPFEVVLWIIAVAMNS